MDGGHSPVVARIGPNAITQLVAVLDRTQGRTVRDAVLARAGILPPAPDSGMIPETDAAAAHGALRQLLPDDADALLRLAGLATGDYILTHRIPRAARILIRILPSAFGARLLTSAIARHAWTFAGSGTFRVVSHRPLTFQVTGNPLIAGHVAAHPQCHWHAAVFERLFTRLVWPGATVTETTCAATGAECCTFVLRRSPGEIS
jgi:divinyl protochlorophyllide a 8-vinyl-reductase